MSEPDDHHARTRDEPHPDEREQRSRLTVFQVMGSTLAAAFGVQKRAHRERDFTHGRPAQFIAAGIIFTVLFVLAVIVIVRLVLRAAGV